jgi:hypothetical protein
LGTAEAQRKPRGHKLTETTTEKKLFAYPQNSSIPDGNWLYTL